MWEQLSNMFDEDVFNNEGARLSDALSFILTLSYDENNLQKLIPCEEENPYDPDGDPLYTGWTYNSEQTSISIGGEGSSFAIESIESVNGTTKEQAITQLDTIPIPTIAGMPFGILGGLVSPDTDGINSMVFSITNNSSFPETINFSLSLPNFENNGNIFLIDNIEVTTDDEEGVEIGDDGDFSNHEFYYYAGCNLINTESNCINNCDYINYINYSITITIC